MYVDAEHVRTLALQQTRDELASPASPPPVVASNTRARERLDALVEEYIHSKYSAGALMPFAAEVRAEHCHLLPPAHLLRAHALTL